MLSLQDCEKIFKQLKMQREQERERDAKQTNDLRIWTERVEEEK